MKTTFRFPGLSFVRAFVQKQPAFRRTVFLVCQRFARIPALRRSTASVLMAVMLASTAVPLLAAVTIIISPTTATLTVGTTKQFTTTVSGSTNMGVTWTATSGTVSTTGLYTAPATAGTYTVTAKSNADTTKKANATVRVVAAPAIASFTSAKSTISAGTSTTLTGTFSNGTGSVDNSVGAVTSGTAKTVTPAATTTYTLTVTNTAGSTATATRQITVVATPNSTITAATPVTTGSTGLTASVPTQAGSTYAWSATGGSITSATNTNSVTYTAGAVGTLNLQCIVTNAAGTASTGTKAVSVVAAPAIASFTSAKSTITAGTSTTLTGTFSNGTGSVDNGAGAVTSGTAKTVTPAATTTYTLTVINTAGTVVTATTQIIVVAAPVSSITALTSVTAGSTGLTASVPSQTGSTYAWTISGGAITSATNTNSITYTAGAAGTLNLQCIVTNAAGTASTGTKVITVVATPVIASFSSAKSPITAGTSTTLTGAFSNGTGSVDNGVGAVTSGTAATVSPAATTTYTLTVTNAANTTAATTSQVVVVATPDSTITATSPVLSGATGLTASVPNQAGSTYAWTITGGTITSGVNANSLIYTAGSAGTLTLQCIVTNSAGTASTGTKAITVNPNITVSVSPASASLIVGDTQIFTATVLGTGMTAVTWAVQESGGGSIATDGTYTAPATPGVYHIVAASVADATKTATATVTVGLLDMSGTYTDSYGATFTLFQNGNQVWGIRQVSYQIVATLSGRTLTGTQNNPDGTPALNFVWTFAPDASSYSGLWALGLATPTTSWTGTKQPGVSVDVNPKPAVLQVGVSQAFTASVAGSPNKAVTWVVTAGTIDSVGHFTAPAQPQVVTVTATSVVDPTKSNSVTFQVTVDGLFDITGSYDSTYGPFTIYQSGSTILWGSSTNPANQGTLVGNVMTSNWTNPDGTKQNLKWTFSSDASTFNGAWGWNSDAPTNGWSGTKKPGVVSTLIASPQQVLKVSASQTFSALVAGNLNKTVQWSATAGTIDSTGYFTAPAQAQNVTVTATSVADPTKSNSILIQVTTDGLLDVSGTYSDNYSQTFTLFQNGPQVWGVRGGQPIMATLSGKTLTGIANYPDGSLALNFVWTFASDASSFTGLYALGSATPNTGWNGTKQPGISMDVNPKPAAIQTGALQAFATTVAGSPNKAVTWATTAGTIDTTGHFTAPSQPQVVTVTATSVADPAKSYSVVFEATADGFLDVSGTFTGSQPGSGTLFQKGASVYGTLGNVVFQGTLTGRVLSGTCQDPYNGVRYFSFTFTPDGNQFIGGYNLIAPGPTAETSATGTRQPGVVSVDLTPLKPVVKVGGTQVFNATVAGSFNKAVIWTSSTGTIDATGLFTAPVQPQIVTITATPAADPAKAVSTQVQTTLDGFLDVSGTFTGSQPGSGTLFQNGASVYGTLGNVVFQGTLNGRVLSGTNQDSYNGVRYFYFTFTPDGNQFIGGYNLVAPGPTADTSATGTRQPGVVSLDLNPKFPAIKLGSGQDFTVLVAGTLDKSRVWSATAGSFDASGHFTAPALGQTVTITVASGAVPTSTTSTKAQVTLDGVHDVSGTFSGYQPGLGTFFQTGTNVEGTFDKSGVFAGTLNGLVLTGTGNAGYFKFTFAPDTNSFSGAYGSSTPAATSGLSAGATRVAGASVKVSPATSVVPFPWNQGFLGLVAGNLDKRVTWSVVEANGGTITSAGAYSSPNLAGTYTVKATSVADATASGTATVQVPFQISIDPNAVVIRPSSSIKLKATVTGTPNAGVTWTVQESGGGSIASDGTYTAPATLGFYHVVATSAADSTKTATAQVTVAAAAPVSVSVAPYSVQLGKSGTTTFVATVQGATNTAVTWTASAGTIDAGGAYTAPNAYGTYTVTATSVADPTAFAVATVVVAAQAGQDKAFTYDLNGNMTSDGARTFEWDDENRLLAVNIVATGHRSEFRYDGLGRRVGIVEKDNAVITSDKKYLWDVRDIAEERSADGGSVQKRFYNRGFVDNDGTNLYYTKDHLGSIRELTDSSQAVRARYDYDPYGRMTKLQGDRDTVIGYTGHLWHAPSALWLTFFRAYDSSLGIWISRDPIEEVEGQQYRLSKENVNLYSFVFSNPINHIDEFGLCKRDPQKPKNPCGDGLPEPDHGNLLKLAECLAKVETDMTSCMAHANSWIPYMTAYHIGKCQQQHTKGYLDCHCLYDD